MTLTALKLREVCKLKLVAALSPHYNTIDQVALQSSPTDYGGG